MPPEWLKPPGKPANKKHNRWKKALLFSHKNNHLSDGYFCWFRGQDTIGYLF
jgi:hypothetical protein